MRTYLILKDKAARFSADPEVRVLLAEISASDGALAGYFGPYTSAKAAALKAHAFDCPAIAKRGLRYERLDQLMIDILTGVR